LASACVLNAETDGLAKGEMRRLAIMAERRAAMEREEIMMLLVCGKIANR